MKYKLNVNRDVDVDGHSEDEMSYILNLLFPSIPQGSLKELKMNAYRVERIQKFRLTRDAVKHAENCLESCGGWDVESLGYNIECNFPEINSDKCDAIAAAVMRKVGLL